MQPHHQRAGKGIERNLLRGPGFQARAAGDDFRARVQRDADVGLLGYRRVRVVGESDRQSTVRFGGLQRAHHIRCRTRGGQQNHHVLCIDIRLRNVVRAQICIIFCALHCFVYRRRPTGQQRHCARVGPGKRRAELYTVEQA